MVYSCWLPAVGALTAASKMVATSSAEIALSKNARTDFRSLSCFITSFIAVLLYSFYNTIVKILSAKVNKKNPLDFSKGT